MVLTAAAGFLLASRPPVEWMRLLWVSIGVALASAATGCLNQVMEVSEDSRMRRTRGRPLPQGRLRPVPAAAFGAALAVFGGLVLLKRVNPLSFALTVFTLASYLLVYTPLKKKSSLALWIGAIPGAMPPLIGWAAAAGNLPSAAWVLFAIQFLWQIPHFLALSWLYREDYARAGFRVASLDDPSGSSLARQMGAASLLLAAASLAPYALGSGGAGCAAGAAALGLVSTAVGLKPVWVFSERNVREVFLASLVYLPCVYFLLLASV